MTNLYSNRQLIFSDENNQKEFITVTICETFDTSCSYGLYLWPCAPILAQYIWYHRTDFVGKKILEIGAGTSLPGLVAAKIGAQNVILCDNPKVDRWDSLIRETISLNNMIADRIRLEFLDWYEEKSINNLIEKYSIYQWDFIFGSDIFFHKKDFETILALLDRLFTSGSIGLKFFGTIERRSRSTMLKLNYLVDLWQMKMQIIPLNSFNGETIAPHLVAGHDILVISLTKNA